MTGFTGKIRQLVAPLGSGASGLSGSFAAGCVGPLAPLATLTSALGLDWLHLLSVQMPILYGTTGLTLASLSLGVWRHGRFWPLLLGMLGIAGILYPFHDALDVTVFRVLFYGGAGMLFVAVAWDLVLGRATCPRSDIGGT